MSAFDELYHYGTKRHSGRYPWGSGENPYQHDDRGFLNTVTALKKEGMTETEIAEALGMSTTQLRAQKSISRNAVRAENVAQALKYKEHGYSNSEIARKMGVNESTVRQWLDPAIQERADKATNTAEKLKQFVDDKKYLDIGVGVEKQLGVTDTTLKTAVAMLEQEGYKKQYIKVEQATMPGQYTSTLVLTKDDVPYTELYSNRDKISSPLGTYSEDGGRTWGNIEPPRSVSSDRIAIRYAEDGGKEKDGVIELRPGVADISLGDSRYAQVRIAVDDTHYLKGMAIYSNDLPEGVDIRFNTNKTKDVPKMEVLKTMKDSEENPFGSTVRQRHYIDENGKEQLSAINLVNDDSDWTKWSKNLPSQFLSKQSPELAKRQLDLTYKQKKQEFDEISSLTNPAIKRKLLEDFADGCDSSAVNLKAAALPRQATHVILPVQSLKDNEIYAPNYKNGEEVVLIRFPHGGTFEIPRLKVNNRNSEAREVLGNAAHAVGINSTVAQQLSGADFDGDTVIVIPTANQKIKSKSPLRDLEGFDPQERYPAYEGMPKTCAANGFHKQQQMGKVSNLITDMTIRGATDAEIARAVKHSMVVIDAEKHNLNWRLSEKDNDIAQLKAKYQGGSNRGASTLISKAGSDDRVPQREDRYDIDPETGKKIYKYTGETYVDKDGKVKERKDKTTKMAEVEDAYLLSSGTVMENIYADHANRLKALGNEARKEYVSTSLERRSPSAAKTYADEVSSLKAKLEVAQSNAPRERQAQILADVQFREQKRANPNMEKDEEKKIRAQALNEARTRVNAHRVRVDITPREWEAIQAHAISPTTLIEVLRFADNDQVKQYAMPRNTTGIPASALSRAKALMKAGFTQAEAAEAIGVSASTLNKELNR